MSDLIDKQSVVDIAMCYCPDDDGSCSKADADIRELLDEIENLQAVNRWIPCSERLPEENKVVLVSTTTGYVDFAVLRWGKWFPDGYNGVAFPPNRITAWMPKPDAYIPTEVTQDEQT